MIVAFTVWIERVLLTKCHVLIITFVTAESAATKTNR